MKAEGPIAKGPVDPRAPAPEAPPVDGDAVVLDEEAPAQLVARPTPLVVKVEGSNYEGVRLGDLVIAVRTTEP